jgi:C-terminal processing protease CtpA/Prc
MTHRARLVGTTLVTVAAVAAMTMAVVMDVLDSSPVPPSPAQQSFTSEQFVADFDTMWTSLRDNYAYLDKKETDWNKVREIYRSRLRELKSRDEFVTLLEHTLDEFYDNHLSLNTNLNTSSRLIPTGLDVWAEWIQGRPVVTQLRSGFSAEQAGIKVGMEIVSVNGVPIKDAVDRRLPKSLKKIDDEAKNWALRAVLAGTHDQGRVIEARDRRGSVAVYRLDLPGQMTVDAYEYISKVEWKMLPKQVGYIKINDLISGQIVAQFDFALEKARESRGMILDLRDIPRGGNTDVAEPILGRFIDRQVGYQQIVPLRAPAYVRPVSPRGPWTYTAPLVVLVNRWTGSMGEGMTIGLDGMRRALVVGTPMAGLNGGVFNLVLPNTKIVVGYPGERLNHVSGIPRETFVPPVRVNLFDVQAQARDPIFEAGYERLTRVIEHR